MYLSQKGNEMFLTRKQFVNWSAPRGTTTGAGTALPYDEKSCDSIDNSTSRCLAYEISRDDSRFIFFFFFSNNLPRYLRVTRISVETWTRKKTNSIGKKREVKRWHRETKTERIPERIRKTNRKENVFGSCVSSRYQPYYTIVNR